MATEVDRIVTVLEAQVADHDRKMQNSARVVDVSMGQIATSTGRAEQAVSAASGTIARDMARAGNASRNVGRQIADVGAQLAGGQSFFMILAQQAPQFADAMADSQGRVAAFARFLSGPWGAAILAGASVLGVLISKQMEASESAEDLSDKMRKKARESERTRQAEVLFAKTIEGVTEALHKNREALDQLSDADKTAARRALESALGQVARLAGIRAETEELIKNARARVERNRTMLSSLASPQARDFAAQDIAAAQSRLDDLQGSLAKTDKQIAEARRQIAEALSQRVVERTDMNQVERIRTRYEGLINSARQRAVAEGTVSTELAKQVRLLSTRRDAEIKRAQEAARPPRTSDRRTKQQAYQDFTGALRERGVAITSGYRTQSQQDALRRRLGSDAARFSLHTSHRAVDVPLSVSDEAIRAAAAEAGLKGLTIKRKPNAKGGPHAHVSWSGYGDRGDDAAVMAGAQRDAREEEQERQRRLRDEAAFQDELAQLNGELLQSRRATLTAADEQVTYEIQGINAARDRQNASYAAAVAQDRLTAAQAEQLTAANDQVAREKVRAVLLRSWQRLDEERYRIAMADLNDQQAMEQARGRLARTVEERRESELRLLDLQQQEERLAMRRLQAAEGLTNAERVRLQRSEAAMTERHGLERQSVVQQNLSPLENFLDDIPRTAAEINEALESIAVDGLRSLTDGLTDAATKFLKLGGIAGNVVNQIIADLMRLAISQNITKPLIDLLGGLFSGAKFDAAGFSAIEGANKSFLSGLGGRASGGHVSPGQMYRVNEGAGRGRVEGFIPAGAGKIVPLGQMERALGGGTTVVQPVHFDLRGALMTEDILAQMNALADQAAQRGAVGGLALSARQSRRSASRRLR